MSRRHHGRPNRTSLGSADGPWRATGVESRPSGAPLPPPERPDLEPPAIVEAPVRASGPAASTSLVVVGTTALTVAASPIAPLASNPNAPDQRPAQCTAPQLRRFIKSRPYVPMHELRRRFAIDGEDDDVTPVRLDPGWIYVGLPSHEGLLLGDLLRTGEIGYELSLDPRSPIVIGVYPMRPIARN